MFECGKYYADRSEVLSFSPFSDRYMETMIFPVYGDMVDFVDPFYTDKNGKNLIECLCDFTGCLKK